MLFFFKFLLGNTGVKRKKSRSCISIIKVQTLVARVIIMSKARVVLCFYQALEVQLSAQVFLRGVFSLLRVIRVLFA